MNVNGNPILFQHINLTWPLERIQIYTSFPHEINNISLIPYNMDYNLKLSDPFLISLFLFL